MAPVVFDVYGRFRVAAQRNVDGAWVMYRLGAEGKRSRLMDVIVSQEASVDEIEQALEAIFHELARPGTSIVRLSNGTQPPR